LWNANAQTLAQKDPQGLWEFLSALPSAWETQLFIGLMIAGGVGMFSHYALKWAREEIKENLLCHLAHNYKSTLLSIFTYIGIAVTAIASQAFTGEYGGFVGWKTVFWLGITNGFTIDAIVNKTERARWTPIEREVKGKRRG
jgi:hypothetical protein